MTTMSQWSAITIDSEDNSPAVWGLEEQELIASQGGSAREDKLGVVEDLMKALNLIHSEFFSSFDLFLCRVHPGAFLEQEPQSWNMSWVVLICICAKDKGGYIFKNKELKTPAKIGPHMK